MSSTRKTDVEKVDKLLKERKRRARINDALLQLKSMVLQSVNRESISMSKLEKADILEMTIGYIQHLRNMRVQETHSADASYANGFNECTSYVVDYLTCKTGNEDNNDIVKQGLLEHMANYPLTKETEPPSTGHFKGYTADDEITFSPASLKNKVGTEYDTYERHTYSNQEEATSSNVHSLQLNESCISKQPMGTMSPHVVDETYLRKLQIDTMSPNVANETYLQKLQMNTMPQNVVDETYLRKLQMNTMPQNVVDESYLRKLQMDTMSPNVVDDSNLSKQQMDTTSPNVVDETYLRKLQMDTLSQSVVTIPKKRKVLGDIQLGHNTSNNDNITKRKRDDNVALSKPLKKRTITFQEASNEDLENVNNFLHNEVSLSNGYVRRTSEHYSANENNVCLTAFQNRDCRTLNIAEDNCIGMSTDGNGVRMKNHWVPNEGIFYNAANVSNTTKNTSSENIIFESPCNLENTVQQKMFYRANYETFTYMKVLENGASNNFSNDTVWRPW